MPITAEDLDAIEILLQKARHMQTMKETSDTDGRVIGQDGEGNDVTHTDSPAVKSRITGARDTAINNLKTAVAALTP